MKNILNSMLKNLLVFVLMIGLAQLFFCGLGFYIFNAYSKSILSIEGSVLFGIILIAYGLIFILLIPLTVVLIIIRAECQDNIKLFLEDGRWIFYKISLIVMLILSIPLLGLDAQQQIAMKSFHNKAVSVSQMSKIFKYDDVNPVVSIGEKLYIYLPPCAIPKDYDGQKISVKLKNIMKILAEKEEQHENTQLEKNEIYEDIQLEISTTADDDIYHACLKTSEINEIPMNILCLIFVSENIDQYSHLINILDKDTKEDIYNFVNISTKSF